MQQSGHHLLDLINDVLDISKMEAGQLTLALNDYSLAEVVQTVFSAVESLAVEKGTGAHGRAAGRSSTRQRRRAAPGAGTPEPARQRHQVHRSRRGAGTGDGRRRRFHSGRV